MMRARRNGAVGSLCTARDLLVCDTLTGTNWVADAAKNRCRKGRSGLVCASLRQKEGAKAVRARVVPQLSSLVLGWLPVLQFLGQTKLHKLVLRSSGGSTPPK